MTTTAYKINDTWQGEHGEDIHFEGIIQLDDLVTKTVDEEWQHTFYTLSTDQEIAEHIAFNMVVNNASLSRLDGFANLPDDCAILKESTNPVMQQITCHEHGHEFMDWIRTIHPVWKGKQNESWISFEEYARARFRDWATNTKLPRNLWNEVFKEYMED